jgi:hypothetical protein
MKSRLHQLHVRGGTTILGVASSLALSACAFDDPRGGDDHATEVVERTLSPNPCTRVKLTLPTRHFLSPNLVPMMVNATATCPPGQTAEFYYWVKKWGAPNWTHIESYSQDSAIWTPQVEGAWCVTVVAREVGTPEDYQTRASAHCGTISHNCGTATVAPPDPSDHANAGRRDALEANALLAGAGDGDDGDDD